MVVAARNRGTRPSTLPRLDFRHHTRSAEIKGIRGLCPISVIGWASRGDEGI
jgi:hypothetical protein